MSSEFDLDIYWRSNKAHKTYHLYNSTTWTRASKLSSGIRHIVLVHARFLLFPLDTGYLKKLVPDSAPQDPENFEDIFKDIERVIMPGVRRETKLQLHTSAHLRCVLIRSRIGTVLTSTRTSRPETPTPPSSPTFSPTPSAALVSAGCEQHSTLLICVRCVT